MSTSIIRVLTKSLFFSLVFTAIFIAALVGYLIKSDKQYKTRLYPHVFVNNIDFSGKKKEAIARYFEPLNSKLSRSVITLYYEDSVATFSGKTLKLGYNVDVIKTQAFSIGRSPNRLTRLYQKTATLLDLERYDFNFVPSYDLKPVNDYLATVDKTYSEEPLDALFTVKNGRVTAFRAEKNGSKIMKEATLVQVNDTIAAIGTDKVATDSAVVAIKKEVLKPKITLSTVNNLGIVEKIGEGSSTFRGSAAERVHNVELSAIKLNGTLIPPGEVFSYNKSVGDISSATGFKQALVIKGGKTVLGDGGGVCQDSTTMFRAALDAGLPIVERHAHGYRVRYYEQDRKPGFDATIYSPSIDFRFKNDTKSHILIQSTVNRATSSLTFSLYGKNDGRKVTLSDATIYGVTSPPATVYQDDPGLKRGITKQVEWAAPGTKSTFHYKVTSAQGKIIQEKDFYSAYRPWRAVYLVGTAD